MPTGMKTTALGALLGTLVALYLYAYPWTGPAWGAADAVVDPQELLRELGRQIAQLDPDDPEAQRLSRAVAGIRKKMQQTKPKAQDPGAFLEGLAQVKTGVDGATYPAGYKVLELRMALQRSTGALTKAQAPTWVERGPGNVSGRARAVVVDPADPSGNSWFVATVGGGIWFTADAGATWTPKTPELTTQSTTTLAISASNPDVIYVGTGMGYGRIIDLSGSGVWKSVDHGNTWSQLPNSAKGELLGAINRIVVDPNDENVVLVASNNSYTYLSTKGGNRTSGIFRSSDGGSSWTKVFDPDIVFGAQTDNRVQQIISNPQNFNTLYATVNEIGVVKSVDGGLTWSVSVATLAGAFLNGVQEGTYQGISTRTEIAIAPTDTSRLYAAVERWGGIGDLYMTTDAGANWVLVNDTGNDPNWFNSFGLSGALSYVAGWFDNTIAVHPTNPNVVFVGGVNTYRMDINPATAERSTTPIAWNWPNSQGLSFAHADHHFLATIMDTDGSGNFRVLDANDGGLAVSPDSGNSWQQLTGMVSTQLYGVDKKPGEDVFIIGMQDNGTWRSGADPTASSPWVKDWGGDGVETVWNAANPDLILAGTQWGTLIRSTDGGSGWSAVASGATGNGPFITKIAGSKIDPDLVFTLSRFGIHRSDDFGANWTLTPITGNWIGNRAFDNVEISVANPQVVWATSKIDFDIPRGTGGGVYVSADGGLSFTDISTSLPRSVNESSGIGTSPLDESTAYLLFSAPDNPKILKTTNLGLTWEDISGFTPSSSTSTRGLPNVAFFALLVMPFDSDQIWAGTEIGLFISQDGGASWAYADNGLPQVSIFQLAIVDETVLVATYGRGLWTATLPELAGYSPPTVTLAPRLSQPAQLPNGLVATTLDMRSAYDSTTVFVNGAAAFRLGANAAAKDTALLYAAGGEETLIIEARSFKDGRSYSTPSYVVIIRPLSIVAQYGANFNFGDSGDFFGTGFSVTTATGFTSGAIHTAHPYPQATQLTYQLGASIIVAEQSEAVMTFDEIVLVEEGIVSDYLNANFFDFVIVEGTTDGVDWRPLVDGYDSRAAAIWTAAYNANIVGINSVTPGTESLYLTRTINFTDTFSAQDTIAIRFRLFSDPLAVGWGWAIDNLQIQGGTLGTGDVAAGLPTKFELRQNYPNPFNPSTVISFDLPQPAEVRITVYDLGGRLVRVLTSGVTEAGNHELIWSGLDHSGRRVPSGVYLARLTSAQYTQSIKMVFLK
ncbi:MAG: T9SS type A sorting domain-containing protein [Candidatus Marinimicrobia bacterium]|nr:T9SS type A sorting domain-containing protein [Candidatus Neomarinimicrobiota bacterium]